MSQPRLQERDIGLQPFAETAPCRRPGCVGGGRRDRMERWIRIRRRLHIRRAIERRLFGVLPGVCRGWHIGGTLLPLHRDDQCQQAHHRGRAIQTQPVCRDRSVRWQAAQLKPTISIPAVPAFRDRATVNPTGSPDDSPVLHGPAETRSASCPEETASRSTCMARPNSCH